MKKTFSILLLLSIIITAAFPAIALAAAPAGRLMVYTSIPTTQLDMMMAMFNNRYPGITVDVFSASSADVFARLQAEAGAPKGDLVLGGGLEAYRAAEGLLSAYASPNAGSFHQDYAAQAFTPFQLHVSAMIINDKLARDLGVTVTGWESLADEKLTGRMAYMDPAASSPDEQQAAFVKGFARSVNVSAPSAPSFVLNAVSAGQFAVGIISEEKAIERKLAGADLSIVYAQEGVAMGASYAGVIENAENQANAQLFLDFITSREYQQAAADRLHQRSVRMDVSFGLAGIAPTAELRRVSFESLGLKVIASDAASR
ncbi:MAG: extracellular solute-binding protein [Eubacteriales bacterium]|nr:extracellular solute-binding protein [Eubacteriales bacterium]